MITLLVAELFRILIYANWVTYCMTSQYGSKWWNICANATSTGLKFSRVDVLEELHIVIVVMTSS